MSSSPPDSNLADSSLQLATGSLGDPSTAADSSAASAAGLWLNGDVLACSCPDCGAPMTVRLWLMTADCWRCTTSIELTLEQEREAHRLLAEREKARDATARSKRPKKPPPAAAPAPQAPPAPRDRRKPTPPAAPVRREPPRRDKQRRETERREPPRQPAAAPQRRSAPVRIDTRGSQMAAELRATSAWRDLPAWLVSLVFHLVLIILLGMWTFDDEEHLPDLTLTASVGPQKRTGGEVESEVEFNADEFDLPVDEKPKTEKQRKALVKADQDARELRIDLDEAASRLPDLARVRADLNSNDPYRRMHAARDPRVRAEVVRREGGTTLTEAAVARALRWIATHQNSNGSWSLHEFHKAGKCKCDGRGQIRSDTAGTSLALMAFLGTGQTHKVGRYKGQVSRGLRWLLEHQKPDGDLRHDSSGNSGMYAHALAALVLCDAFKVSGEEMLRGPAQKSIDFVCAAQHKGGGWRYKPGEAGDTSVVGWQLMALHSGRAAYLNVPEETLERAGVFLDSVARDKHGATYGYRPGDHASPTRTSIGLLSRMYLGWNRRDEGLQRGVQQLADKYLPDRRRPDIYYWYYATQVMHHWGGKPWEEWNGAIRDALVATQQTSGHDAGSWDPKTPHGAAGGRLYMTALAACTLEVYYRYAPLYWQLELD